MEQKIETKTEPKQGALGKPWIKTVSGIAVIAAIVATALIYKSVSARVSIDRSIISAPVINIGPQASGILEETYVHNGDAVTAGQALATVGSETLTAKIDGIVLDAVNAPGQVFSSSQPVVRMIDPKELRIVGTIKENEGLSYVKIGEPVSFTVDAFGGKEFTGVITEISPTSKESGVTFSISDRRETKEFEVKASFDAAAHPEFKNGMSAKMKVYKK